MKQHIIPALLVTITALQGLSLLAEDTQSKTTVEKSKAQIWFEAECEEIARWHITRNATRTFKFTRQGHPPLCGLMLDKHPEWAMQYVK